MPDTLKPAWALPARLGPTCSAQQRRCTTVTVREMIAVQIVAVGKPNRRALNTRLLTAIGRIAIDQDRAESLLFMLASEHVSTLLSEAGADVCPSFTHRPYVTEEISA